MSRLRCDQAHVPSAPAVERSTGVIGTAPLCQKSADTFGTPSGDLATVCYDKSVAARDEGKLSTWRPGAHERGSGIG